MTKEPKVVKGSEVFVRDPQRFITDCTCIIGNVLKVFIRPSGKWAVIHADVGRMGGGGGSIDVALRIEEVGVRHLGTPISKISGRPGHPGYAEWLRISQSWGHP